MPIETEYKLGVINIVLGNHMVLCLAFLHRLRQFASWKVSGMIFHSQCAKNCKKLLAREQDYA